MRVNLLIAISRGFTHLMVEAGSHLIFNELFRGSENKYRAALLQDCQHFFSSFQSIQIRFTYREGNQAADSLAKYACQLEPLQSHAFVSSPCIFCKVLRQDQAGVFHYRTRSTILMHEYVLMKWYYGTIELGRMYEGWFLQCIFGSYIT